MVSAACLDGGQHDEMVEVPVQYGRQRELVEIFQLDLDRPRLESEAVGQADEIVERGPCQETECWRRKRRQVGPVAVERSHHRKTGEAALGRLGLQDERDAVAAR